MLKEHTNAMKRGILHQTALIAIFTDGSCFKDAGTLWFKGSLERLALTRLEFCHLRLDGEWVVNRPLYLCVQVPKTV